MVHSILDGIGYSSGDSQKTATMGIEDLKRRIAELEQIKERYELSAVGSTAGIWDWDIPSDKVYYSDRFNELLGYGPGDLSDSPNEFWNRLHPDDHHLVRTATERHFKEHAPYIVDCRLRTRSGEYRWFHSRAQAIWNEAGQAIRMSGSAADITGRKHAEAKLIRSENQFRRLMEQSPLAMEILSPEGQIVRYNKAWLKLWGVNEKEGDQVIARYNMITDPQVEELGILPLVERAFSGEAVVLPLIHYSGEKVAEDFGLDIRYPHSVWIQSHLYPIKDEAGNVVNVVNTYMDLTSIKLAEQEAREHREALARVHRAISMGQLTGSISHELNQPLTGILSNAQAAELLIDRGILDRDELAGIISAIIADTRRAGELIRNLRELYREQKGELLPVDINKIVAETIDLMHSELIVRNVLLSQKYAPTVPEVSGIKIQIQQVLLNIFMNSMQAMSNLDKAEHKLNVETVAQGDEVLVLVEDNGPGIDGDKIDSIFEPMATWKPEGTGMGLAISNAIIKAHGGRMFAANRPEGGALVGFAIPVKEEDKKRE